MQGESLSKWRAKDLAKEERADGKGQRKGLCCHWKPGLKSPPPVACLLFNPQCKWLHLQKEAERVSISERLSLPTAAPHRCPGKEAPPGGTACLTEMDALEGEVLEVVGI